jgi:hypothetical protein
MMERLADKQQEEVIKARVKEVLARRQRDGEGCPAILVIDATHGLQLDPDEIDLVGDNFVLMKTLPTYCFDAFDEFERKALEQGDRSGVEQVREAMAERRGRLIVYTMFPWARVVSVVHKNVAEMERTIGSDAGER